VGAPTLLHCMYMLCIRVAAHREEGLCPRRKQHQ